MQCREDQMWRDMAVTQKKRRSWAWKTCDYVFCALLFASTLDIVTHQTFFGLSAVAALAGLMAGRIAVSLALALGSLRVRR
jgi:cytosine/uracil/thiamine/allantoin permease